MAVRTIDDIKADLDARWIEYATLQSELAAIDATRNVIVDLSKSLADFLIDAEQRFATAKSTYESELKIKNAEITVKMNEIKALLEEAKILLFDSNGVQYLQP